MIRKKPVQHLDRGVGPRDNAGRPSHGNPAKRYAARGNSLKPRDYYCGIARFAFSVCAVTNFAPISSPLTQASAQRRYVRPVDDNRRKNSLSFKPSIESLTLSLAPVSDTSCMMQARRQVPSIAMIETSTPFSKTTLTPLRRSEVAMLCTQDELFSQVT